VFISGVKDIFDAFTCNGLMTLLIASTLHEKLFILSE